MARRESTDGNPSEEQVEQDFSMPDDADLRPADEVGDEEDA